MTSRLGIALTLAFAATLLSPAMAQERSIKIGVINDASGPYSDNAGAGSVVAAKMAAADFMAAHPAIKVEVVSADHQNKPDIGSGIVRKWIEVERVDAVVDIANSAVALAVNELIRGTHAALVASSAASSDLTGKYCSPNTIQWTFDTWASAHTVATYALKHNGRKWFFIATDNALGKSLVRDASAVIAAGGGSVVGAVNAPLNNADYSSYLLRADEAGADVIAFATAGGDTVTLIKQSAEFGLRRPGRLFIAMLATTNDIAASGLAIAKDLIITQPYYWSFDDKTRAFAKRFGEAEHGQMATAFHAGVYSSVLAYLEAAAAAGSNDGPTIVKKMQEKPIDDALFGKSVVRKDGRVIHNMYTFKVKAPEQSKEKWDLLEDVGLLSGEEAFRPIDQGGCSLVSPTK